jgi:hypothetical protein
MQEPSIKEEALASWDTYQKRRFTELILEDILPLFVQAKVKILEDNELNNIFSEVLKSEIVGGENGLNEHESSSILKEIQETVFSPKTHHRERRARAIGLFYGLFVGDVLLEAPMRQQARKFHERFLDNLVIDNNTKNQAEKAFENFLDQYAQLHKEGEEIIQKIKNDDPSAIALALVLKDIKRPKSLPPIQARISKVLLACVVGAIVSTIVGRLPSPNPLNSVGGLITFSPFTYIPPEARATILVIVLPLAIWAWFTAIDKSQEKN